jgi:hypothetical protein
VTIEFWDRLRPQWFARFRDHFRDGKVFWELFGFLVKKPKKSHLEASDFMKEVWSGRPGSNRRRPAWEFSTEFDVFFFCSKNLVAISCF